MEWETSSVKSIVASTESWSRGNIHLKIKLERGQQSRDLEKNICKLIKEMTNS